MEVKVVRKEPSPPPIEKIVVELSQYEAREFVRQVQKNYSTLAERVGWYQYEQQGTADARIARTLEAFLE